MQDEEKNYLTAIGRVTVSFADLEENILWGVLLLSPVDDVRALHAARLKTFIGPLIRELRDLSRQRMSTNRCASMSALLDIADKLRDRRNETTHGHWFAMVDSDTGEYAHYQRSIYYVDEATGRLEWNVSTPPVKELNDLAHEIEGCSQRIKELLEQAWDIDEKVVRWRINREEARRSGQPVPKDTGGVWSTVAAAWSWLACAAIKLWRRRKLTR